VENQNANMQSEKMQKNQSSRSLNFNKTSTSILTKQDSLMQESQFNNLNTGRSELKDMSVRMRSKSNDINFSETKQRGFLLRSEANTYKVKILELKNHVAEKNVEI